MSRDSIVDDDWLRETDWCKRYPSNTLIIRSYGSRENFGGALLVRNVQPRGKIWINSNGKMETRHPVQGQFGSEFPAICNHCGVITAWSRKTWKCFEQFLRFFLGKTAPYGKIFKILFRKFSPGHRSTMLCSNFVKYGRRKIGEVVCYLVDKKTKISFGLHWLRLA